AVAWRQSEIDQLFSAIGRMRGKIGPVDESLWWAALHMLLWDTGERITAMFDLVWEDVDLGARAIICRAETRKGGLEDRVYRISPESVAMLRNMPRAEARVFPWPYTRTYLWNKYTWLLMSAGL